jgi:hypothetical protein
MNDESDEPYFPPPGPGAAEALPYRTAATVLPRTQPQPTVVHRPAAVTSAARTAAPAGSKSPAAVDVRAPGALSDTDPSHRLTEVFGYNGFALAFGGFFCKTAFLVDPAAATRVWYLPAAIAATVLGFGYEMVRRRGRLVLVPTGPGFVAAYRHGRFLLHARTAEFLPYRLNGMSTVQFLVAASTVTLGAALCVVALHGSGRLFAAGATVTGALAFASAVYTRIVCKQYLFSPALREGEYVVLRRSAVARLGLSR